MAVSQRIAAEAPRVRGAGVCAPLGFRAGVAAANVRGDGDGDRLDVAVIRSEVPASAAGVFTRNTVKAAPVVISQLTLRRGTPISAFDDPNNGCIILAEPFFFRERECDSIGKREESHVGGSMLLAGLYYRPEN